MRIEDFLWCVEWIESDVLGKGDMGDRVMGERDHDDGGFCFSSLKY